VIVEWDDEKALANERNHGISFENAVSVLRGDAIRLISARRATRAERRLYEEG